VTYGGPALAADAAYQWTVQARSTAGWGPVAAPAASQRGSAPVTGGRRLAHASAGPQGPDRVTYLRSEFTPLGRPGAGHGYVSAAHTYRLYVDGTPVDAWPSFSYPDEQYVRAVDLTSAFRPARPSASVSSTAGTAPPGRPECRRSALLALAPLRRRVTLVHVSDGSWREHRRVAALAQRNSDGGDFVESVDGPAHPPAGPSRLR